MFVTNDIIQRNRLKIKKVKSTFDEKGILLITLFSTFMLVQFGIFDLFWTVQVLFFMINIVMTRKLLVTKNRAIISLYSVWILSTLFCLRSDIPMSYKENSIIAITVLIPIFFSVSFYERHFKSVRIVATIRKALVLTCVIQVIMCIVQFALYYNVHIDLNQIVFRDFLHMVENPSQYKLGVYHPSGMCWHSAFMAPITIITFVVCDSYFIKVLAVVAAIICNNATAIIGIGICLALSVTFSVIDFLRKTNKTTKKRTFIVVGLIIIIFLLVFLGTDAISIVIEKVIDIYGRATGSVYDGGSANAHIRYFIAYPEVVKNGNVIQFLFGYGTGNSGFTMSKLYGQYTELNSWVVESDVMNQLYSNGIVGFIIYYGFLLYIAFKGYRLNRRYLILMMSIIIAGFTYNIQFSWVLYIEFLLYLSIKNKIDFFRKG